MRGLQIFLLDSILSFLASVLMSPDSVSFYLLKAITNRNRNSNEQIKKKIHHCRQSALRKLNKFMFYKQNTHHINRGLEDFCGFLIFSSSHTHTHTVLFYIFFPHILSSTLSRYDLPLFCFARKKKSNLIHT